MFSSAAPIIHVHMTQLCVWLCLHVCGRIINLHVPGCSGTYLCQSQIIRFKLVCVCVCLCVRVCACNFLHYLCYMTCPVSLHLLTADVVGVTPLRLISHFDLLFYSFMFPQEIWTPLFYSPSLSICDSSCNVNSTQESWGDRSQVSAPQCCPM